MNVTAQEDRLFAGEIAYVVNGSPLTKPFAGVNRPGRRTVAMVEFRTGSMTVIIVSENEIQLVFRDDGTPYDDRDSITFRRVA